MPGTTPVTYTLDVSAPGAHVFEVCAELPAGGGPELDLMLPVWTPGSYLVREYARHIEGVRAESASGEPRTAYKTAKNRWRVSTGGEDVVRVCYRVYGRELTVRTNFVDAEFALLNGAATYLTLAGGEPRPHVVRLRLPHGWTAVTALDETGTPHVYRARDYDTLVDSPIVAGNPAVRSFTVNGTPHVLATVGEAGVWEGARAAADLETIVRAHLAFWTELPYARYVFLNLLVEANGGIEHAASTVLMGSRWRTRTRPAYVDWLNLASHELFHAWNGKRLRPAAHGPFDYEREVYTRSLWIVEGLTEYYGDLLVRRAGLATDREYLDCLSAQIHDLQTTPGRFVQPLSLASFDAWIRHYRPDEHSPNAAVSYYTKGAVVGFLLDMEIRRATDGRRSLDDVLRRAYARFAGGRGFEESEFRELVSEVAGVDRSRWLARAIDETGELDYGPALAWLGLRFSSPTESEVTKAWLGVSTRSDAGRLVVTQVRRGAPAHAAGLNVDDEVIAIDEFRVRPDGWERRLEAYRPDDVVTLLVARRERLLRLDVTLGSEPRRWRLEPDPLADARQRAARAAWLGSPIEPAR